MTAFQLEKSVKHESYYDILNDVCKKYNVGLRLYPDSELSPQTRFHYAMYDGEDHAFIDNPVIFSLDFENLKKSKDTDCFF